MKWWRKKRAAPGRSSDRHFLGRHRPRFELLEQRQLLTASTATPAASDLVTATVQPSDKQSGALAAPTISLPTQIGPISQSYATQINGIWLSDPGASQITVTLSVQHGTLSLSQYEGIVYDLQTTDLTISGDGTSTITLTGTAAEIYDVLDVPPDAFTFADGASNATASSATSTSIFDPWQIVSYPENTGSVLYYTPASGYFGNDALTVSAFGTSGSTTSPTATAKLLLADLPPNSGPWIGGFGATLMPTGSGLTATVAFNNNFLPIGDQQAGVNPIVVTVSASYGTLTLNGTTGLTVTGDGTDSLSITGSVSDIDNALNGMTYTPGAGFTGSDTLEFTANDQGYNALHHVQTASNSVALQTQWISVPGSQNIGTASSLAFNAANGTAISVSDFDLAGADLQLEISAGYGATLKFGETAGLTFVNTTNGKSVMVVEGTAAALNSALATLVYTPPSPPPYSGGLTYDTVALALSDPSGGLSPNSTLVQNTQIGVISGPNDTPLTAPGQATFTQPPLQAVGLGTPVTFSNANGNAIVISDPGMGNTIESLTLAVTEGTLKLAEENGITFKYGANGSSTITIQGTLTALNAAIDGLVYTPNSGFAGIDTLSLGFSYPNNNYGYGSANITIDEGADNQGVPISTPGRVQNATPAAPIIFSSTGGNAITLGNPGISATTPVQLLLSIDDGSLSLSETSGISIVSGASGSSAMTIQGTLAAINAALDRMTYTPVTGHVGWTELDLKASVPGDSSIGTTFNSVLIQDNLSFVPAVITVPPTQTPSPTTPLVFSSAGGNGISINDPATTGTIQVTLGVSSGALALGNTAGVTITAGASGTGSITLLGTQSAINAALDGLTYTITYGTTNYDTLTIDLTDPGNSALGTVVTSVTIDPTFPFGEIPFSEFLSPQTNVLPAPVVTLPAGPFTVNGTPAPVTGVSVAGAALVELTVSVQNGTLNVSKTAGVEIDNGGTSSIELTGTVANVNAALASLVYTGNAGFVGTDSLSVSATAIAELTPPPDVLNGPGLGGLGGFGNPITYPITNPIGTPIVLAGNVSNFTIGATAAVTNVPSANVSTIKTIGVSLTPPVTTSDIDDSHLYSSVPNQWSTNTSSTTTATLALTVGPPAINVPAAQKMTGLLPLVFSTANGDAISVSDSAVGNSPIQVTLSVANGTLTLASTTGLTFSTGTGTGDTTTTFTGDTSDIAKALDGLSYSADAGFSGTETLNVAVNDLGNGGGSPITVSVSLAIHVERTALPTITISLPTSAYLVTPAGGPVPGVSVTENGSDILQVTLSVQDGVLSVQNAGFSTSVNGTSVETMTSATTGQSVTITGVGTSTMVISGPAAAIDALLRPENPPPPSTSTSPLGAAFFLTPSATPGLVYTPTSGFTGTDTLTVSAKEAGLANAPTTSSSLTLNVQPPTINVPPAQTMAATAPLVFSAALGNAISITQGNVGAGLIQVTLSVADGTLTLTSTAGLTFSQGTGTKGAAMVFTGDAANVNNALAGLSYLPKSGFTGNDKLIISVGTPGVGSTTVSDAVTVCVQQGPAATVPISLSTAPVTIQPVGGQISDVELGDLGTGPSSGLGNAQITFKVQNGTLTLPLEDGLTITGSGTSSITVTGQAGWLDTDLITEVVSSVLSGSSPGQLIGYRVTADGLFYTPYSGYSGPDTLTVTSRSLLVNNAPTTTATMTLNDVAAVAPVVTPSGNQATFTPGGLPVTVDSGIQITSTNTLLSGATVTISPSTFQTTDTLRFSADDGIYGIYANGVLTLGGNATPAEYQAALQSVTFGTGSTNTAARSISIVVFDASLASNTASGQVLISGGSAAPTLKQSPETAPNRSGSSTGSPAVAHGHHSFSSLGMLSGSSGGHNTISLDGTPTGPTSGGFNYYVPPSLRPPVAVTTSQSGGSSTAGTANQTSGKKSFGALDHVFEGFGPDDLLF